MVDGNDVAFYEAYVLRRKPYRETSALVQFWVRDYGLVHSVVKGVHGIHPTARLQNAWLQPFQALSIQMRGRQTLKQVYSFEPLMPPMCLLGQLLLAGQYVNEIISLILAQYEPEVDLFEAYQELFQRFVFLSDAWPDESSDKNYKRTLALQLRMFEQKIVESIGFAIDWVHDHHGYCIEADELYQYMPGVGLVKVDACSASASSEQLICGVVLQAIGCSEWSQAGALGVARYILRQHIEWSLGRSLRSPIVLARLFHEPDGLLLTS